MALENLTPEDAAFLAQHEASTPSKPAFNPVRDLSADDLFSLATQDPDNFHLANEFSRNKDLWGDQALVQKVADVRQRIEDRGLQFSDVPSVGKLVESGVGMLKGLGKQAWNYTSALVVNPALSAIGDITGQGPGFTKELVQQGQRQVMENLAGTEASVTGMTETGKKLARQAARSAAGYSGVEVTTTPEERVKRLWDEAGVEETKKEALAGRGGLLGAVGGEVRKELEAAGKPIRPEEASELAAGDPVAFWGFGKVFQGAGKLVPPQVGQVVEKVVGKAEQVTEAATGRALQAAGVLTELGGKTAQIFGPTAGAIIGTLKAGPFGTFAGEALGRRVQGAARKVAKAGEKLQVVGKEIAGVTPVTTGATQLAKDVVGAIPMAATEIAKGLTFDLGTAALTSESPQDTQSVGIGAFFGGANALRRTGGRIISGQIVGPRAWGSDQYVPPSGKVDQNFENMHIDALKTATPAVRTRLNAVREFLKGSNADTDVFLAKDAPSLAKALTQAGMDAQSAKTASEQEGFFQANIPGKDGTPRRVIFARNVDAAPHEAFHAIQDVLGEDANQMIDQIVRQEYGNQWENEGTRYAQRIDPNSPDWRETVLDSTGTGLNYAKEKIAMDVANEYRNTTGAEPPAKYVQDRAKEIFGQTMDRALQANPGVDPNQIASRVWRDILSTQEATAVADTYLSRELAAENFDAVFKNLGASLQTQGIVGRLARVVANLASTLGIEPLSPERVTQIGKIQPKFAVTEAVRKAPGMMQPRAEVTPRPPSKGPLILPSPSKVSQEQQPVSPPAEKAEVAEARELAAGASDQPVTAGTESPREILGKVAEAIAQQAGVKINYLSAPDEPAAAISSNRDVRRAIIEVFRTMPPEARALWEKNFFPDRVIKLKGDKFQVMGWAPEVFASNAHKLAAKLTELGVAEASPYPIESGTFTTEGWKQLFEDTKTFVQNQMGGRTGAGEPLVVPKGLPGVFAPPEKGRPVALEQTRADFINMLFGFKLPETARLQKGKLPLNIAGQAVSEATKPGRTEVPVIPRGAFEGAEAARQGIAGQQIKEVNPLRQQIEAAAQARGVSMPEFIEAIQRLNLENIKDVQVAPELPQFRGNTLTLSAGFQPQTAKGREMEQKGFTIEPFGYYGTRGVRAVKDGRVVADISSAVHDPNDIHTADVDMVWTAPEFQKQGLAETLYRELGAVLQRDGITKITGTAIHPAPVKIREKVFGPVDVERTRVLDNKEIKDVASRITPEMKFQPPKNVAEAEDTAKNISAMSANEFGKWAESVRSKGGFTEYAWQTGLNAPSRAFVDLLKSTAEAVGEKAGQAASAGNFEDGMLLASQQQFFREAWEAATGEGSAGFALRKEQPGYKPKFPIDGSPKIGDTGAAVQFKPNENDPTETGGATQFQPRAAEEIFKLKPAKQGFSKAWILPNGKPVQLGGQWHHEFINENNALRKLYDLPGNDSTEENRVSALQKGFVRVNYDQKTGRLTVEARTADWKKQKQSVQDFVEANADKIDHISVTLFDRPVEGIQHSEDVKVFQLEDNEKAANVPFLDMSEGPKMTAASEKLFQKSQQFQPQEEPRRRGPGGYFFEQARRYHPLTQELDKLREGDSTGQTFTKTGDVWTPGDKKVDIVTLASVNLPVKNLTPENFREAVAPYKDLLSDDVVAGVFKLDNDTASVDINAVVPQEHRDNTLQFAKDNNQISIWDAVKNETVASGGTGETKITSIDKLKEVLPTLLKGNPVQFQPKETLPGMEEEKRFPTKRELSEMTPEQLGEFYPEAVIPKTTEYIPSNITGSPLFKRAIDEDAAVKIFGDKLAEFSRENADNPLFKMGRQWYEEFTPQLKKEFGADVELFAELLAATSPQTTVAANFGYAVDAIESFRRGRFTKIMSKFNQGLDMMANDTWKAWYNRELKAGNIPDPPVKPTPASFMEAWINKHNLKPRQTNGALYGTHSLPVLQVFARQWLTKSRGPKTLNFVENLLGTSDEATIDLWADRTMRRIGYEGTPRWRVLPRNAAPVSDKDFAFSQKAFRHAAQQLGMKPSSLQAALWFAEKGLWDKNGWSKLDLGDFREQMKRLPALREGIEKRLTVEPKNAKLNL